MSLVVYFSYDKALAGYQFVEKYSWMPMLGISLHFGVDGMSARCTADGYRHVTGVMISWGIEDRPREFFAFLFILASGVFGVFASLDLLCYFSFMKLRSSDVPADLHLGWIKTREYAAMKLTCTCSSARSFR